MTSRSGSRKVTVKGRKGINEPTKMQRTFGTKKNVVPRAAVKKLGSTQSKVGHFSKKRG